MYLVLRIFNKHHRHIFIFSFIVILILYYVYKNRQPFIFINMQKENKEVMYKSSSFIETNYNIKFTQNINEQYLIEISRYFNQYVILQDRDFYTDMISVTESTSNLMSHSSKSCTDKHRNLENILDVSGDYRNVCSEAAKMSTIFWQLPGYKIRVI